MQSPQTTRHIIILITLSFVLFLPFATATAQDPDPAPSATCPVQPAPVALLAGDSWAQLMWDDGSHNDIFDKFGHADRQMVSRSLDTDPGPGYTGPEYAISGSEARQWADTASYPWIANIITDLQAIPTITTVVLSIDGNDILAGKSDDGWYKEMDLDLPGSEEALFNRIEADTWQIVHAVQAVRPDIDVLLSSYDYANFNVGFWCFVYACPKRRDLSRDPDNDLITDIELNTMMVNVEQRRIAWTNTDDRLHFDNSIGLTHYYYGDGSSAPGQLPYPGQAAPDYAPFPGGNPLLPTLRENFCRPSGLDADPIHLDYDSYQYKISSQTMSYFYPRFRGQPDATFYSLGAGEDGWTDGAAAGTDYVRVGSVDGSGRSAIISIDTSTLPDNAIITGASLYLMRQGGAGTSPFQSGVLGIPVIDVATGSFGAPLVEPSDAVAAADAPNAGCTTGTVRQDDYALRIDLMADGLEAINPTGRTQFRLSFPNPSAAANAAADAAVHFSGGEAVLRTGADRLVTRTKTELEMMPNGEMVEVQRTQVAIEHQGLAEYMGSPRPFLDVMYCLPGETGCAGAQEIPLSPGWNILSSHIAPTDPALETLLAGIQSDMVLIKNGSGQVYWPAQGVNTIGSWDVRSGYQIYMNGPTTLSLAGIKIDPAQTPIDLPAGWTMLPYLPDTAMPVDQALNSISGSYTLVKNGSGQVHWPAYQINQIDQMQPGQGYQLHMPTAGLLTYPAN